MLITINIWNLFLTFNYVKHYRLCENLRSTFLVKSKILDHGKPSITNKTIIPIINQEQNFVFRYHLNTQEFEQITPNKKG